MPRIFKSPKAASDLKKIWLYTFDKWGVEQADLYFDQLEYAINHLVDSPKLGKNVDAVRNHYRAIRAKHHVIYYKINGDIITIVRVLHEDMLPTNHL